LIPDYHRPFRSRHVTCRVPPAQGQLGLSVFFFFPPAPITCLISFPKKLPFPPLPRSKSLLRLRASCDSPFFFCSRPFRGALRAEDPSVREDSLLRKLLLFGFPLFSHPPSSSFFFSLVWDFCILRVSPSWVDLPSSNVFHSGLAVVLFTIFFFFYRGFPDLAAAHQLFAQGWPLSGSSPLHPPFFTRPSAFGGKWNTYSPLTDGWTPFLVSLGQCSYSPSFLFWNPLSQQQFSCLPVGEELSSRFSTITFSPYYCS